jgi:hypothetical protein
MSGFVDLPQRKTRSRCERLAYVRKIDTVPITSHATPHSETLDKGVQKSLYIIHSNRNLILRT